MEEGGEREGNMLLVQIDCDGRRCEENGVIKNLMGGKIGRGGGEGYMGRYDLGVRWGQRKTREVEMQIRGTEAGRVYREDRRLYHG